MRCRTFFFFIRCILHRWKMKRKWQATPPVQHDDLVTWHLALVKAFVIGASFSQPKSKELAWDIDSVARDRRGPSPYCHICRLAHTSRRWSQSARSAITSLRGEWWHCKTNRKPIMERVWHLIIKIVRKRCSKIYFKHKVICSFLSNSRIGFSFPSSNACSTWKFFQTAFTIGECTALTPHPEK